MKQKVWGKTLLNVYGCLFRLAREIDKIVVALAINSGYYGGVCKTYGDIKKMIELTNRKITLINLKVLIEKSLVKLDKTSCKILTLKFIDKVSNETIYKLLNMTRRTFYRKYSQAINSFANQLMLNDFNSESCEQFVKDETWIYEIYKNYLEKEVSRSLEGEISQFTIYNLAVNNFRKVRCANFDVNVF